MPRRHRWSLTSGLDGGGWSTQGPGCFTPSKMTLVLVAQEAVWACGLTLSGAENIALRFEPGGVHPVASRHTTTLSLRRIRNIKNHGGIWTVC